MFSYSVKNMLMKSFFFFPDKIISLRLIWQSNRQRLIKARINNSTDYQLPFSLFPFPFSLYSCILYLVLLLSCSFVGCEKQTTPIETATISLTAEYVGVTEAELLLSADLEELPDQYRLFRNGEIVLSGELTDSHTTLWDTTLQPAQTYLYQVRLLRKNDSYFLSNDLTITTIDTTNHNFNWEVFSFGDGNSSELSDVFVVNENDIWAVGTIYVKDSTGQFQYPAYGAVHYNGTNWELIKLTAQAPGYITHLMPKSIIGFGQNNFWIVSGGVHHFDGNKITKSYWINSFPGNSNSILDSGQVLKKIWGFSGNDLYVTGTLGSIAHFDGNFWRKIESGTSLEIQDIWGEKNIRTGDMEIYCVASSKYYGGEGKVFQIKNGNIIELDNLALPWSLSGIWFKAGFGYFISGDGIFYKKNILKQNPWIAIRPNLTNYYLHAVRGNHINDIFCIGSFNTILHFNGFNWKHYTDAGIHWIHSDLRRVYFRKNILAAVGITQSTDILVLGKRVFY